MFLSRPRAIKGKTSPNLHAEKTFFRANSDSECSTYSSGLLTYIIYPCTPSPLASRCQLAPPAPSLLAHELIHAAAALPVAAYASAAVAAAAAAAILCPRLRPPLGTYVAAAAASLPSQPARMSPPPPVVRAPGIPSRIRSTPPVPLPARASGFACPQVHTLPPPPLLLPLSPADHAGTAAARGL
jgi:hypothetical protein